MITLLCFAASLAALNLAHDQTKPPSTFEAIEWTNVWLPHMDENRLPRVLLIGDSITQAYFGPVENLLAGKAYVGRLTTSAFIGDPMFRVQISAVLDSTSFDVIHFNNGLHGWQHSEDEYRKGFPRFLETIRKHAPKAKLIWATTTPTRDGEGDGFAYGPRVTARNQIALHFVQPLGIPVDDLNQLMTGHPEYHSDNYHFNDSAIQIQAKQVAPIIEGQLP